MASARWRTRDRKNSRPVPAAVPSTTARRACKSSGTTEAAAVSPAPAAASRGPGSDDRAESGSWVMRRLRARELRTQRAAGRSGRVEARHDAEHETEAWARPGHATRLGEGMVVRPEKKDEPPAYSACLRA